MKEIEQTTCTSLSKPVHNGTTYSAHLVDRDNVTVVLRVNGKKVDNFKIKE